jgi:hypothetical protein
MESLRHALLAWWRDLLDAWGYLPPRAQAAPAPPSPPMVELAAMRESTAVAAVAAWSLLGTGGPWPAHACPARGRTWWSTSPSLAPEETEVASQGARLEELGKGAELLSWSEAACVPGLPKVLAGALLRFQLDATVLAGQDECPAAWGMVSCQATVALYNTILIVGAIAGGTAPERLRPARTELDRWLRQAPVLGGPETGDLLLLHLIYEAQGRLLRSLEQKVEAAQAPLAGAAKRLAEARKEHELAWWPSLAAARHAARDRWSDAQERRLQLEREVAASRAASAELRRIMANWRALSPLTQVLAPDREVAPRPNPAPAGPATASPARPPAAGQQSAADLVALAVHPRAYGLQSWLIGEMVSRCSLDAIAAGKAQSVLPLLAAEMSPESSQERARLRAFQARFYRRWTLECPPVTAVLEAHPHVSEEMRVAFRDFLGAWKALCKELDQPLPVRRVVDDPWRAAHVEYGLLQEPLPEPESWENRVVRTPTEKLQAVYEHFLRVVGMEIVQSAEEEENGG